MSTSWYQIRTTENVISPSLLVYPKRIEKNILKMIDIAGGTDFLRPHIKTYKMAEVIQLQLKHGIHQFKCATIAEAELLAECGAQDVLLAMQPVGANVDRFFALLKAYPKIKFSTLVDNHQTVTNINNLADKNKVTVSLFLDINNGMNRTGIWPAEEALELYKTMTTCSNILVKGLHVYDGHIRITNFDERKKQCDAAFELVIQLKRNIESSGLKIDTIVAGGTPSFPIHSKRAGIVVSPGTPLLWDQGYTNLFPDLTFLPAAVLFSRIISKPNTNLLCLDLGHKSVASEMQVPRVQFLNIDNYTQIGHSEEHLVLTCDNTDAYHIGDVTYSIPYHICPTVTKYKEVLTVNDGEITGTYKVIARDHKTNI